MAPITVITAPPANSGSGRGWRFWTIIISCTVSSILTALDGSAISTAMPSMVEDLGSTYAYVWIANAYFLTMTAFQPIYGQTSNIFGRQSLILTAVFLFAVGSAICGPAPNLTTLIAGRAIKGIGGGGINVMIEIIVSDLVPLRERPKYIGLMFIAYGVGVAIGPVVGGSLSERVSWRWVFYLNLPIAAAGFIMLVISLKVRYVKDSTRNSLKRVDFGGNALFVASMVSILVGLSWGGVAYPWESWRVLLTLLLGFAGLAAFLVIQCSGLIPEPTMPLRLFTNRTSLAAFGLTLIHSVLMYWQIYFLPLYFQSVLESSPTTSGVYLLPTVIISMIFSVVAGTGLSKMGRYRPWHFSGMALFAIGYGLFFLLDDNSSMAFWAGVQCLGAISIGVLMTTTLPAVQAPLAETDVAVVTGTWGFLRCFGGIWAYGLAFGGFITSLNHDPALKAAVKSIYADSLKLAWQVGIGFALVGVILSLVTKEIPLRMELETQFGLDDGDGQEVEKGTPVKASDEAIDKEEVREKS
ncbi:hypothetical protein DL769_006670 [Monosporascus sp. CRB-8-3]|nr:hypothetical protein DL769_006670 [Monosporascus sp. CRB-8-3]